MLVVLYIDLFDLLLQHLLLVVLDQLIPLLLHLSQLLRQLGFLQRVTLDVFFEFGDFALDLGDDLRPLLVLVLRHEKLLAEQFEGEVFVAHVEFVDFLLDSDLPLEFEVHIDLHRF